MRSKIFFALIFLALVTNAWCQDKLAKVYFVTDSASMLTDEQQSKLVEQLKNLETNIGSQMAILTIESLHGEKIEDYSLRTASNWGLGRKNYNDGILITVALRDQQVRIEVGSGLEKIITDEIAAQIIREEMIPNF